MNTLLTPMLISKEMIPGLEFPLSDVLPSIEKQLDRQKKLEKGMLLGNNYKHKVAIIFSDRNGAKKVETTIWAAMEKNISLKGGAFIPIHRIHDIII